LEQALAEAEKSLEETDIGKYISERDTAKEEAERLQELYDKAVESSTKLEEDIADLRATIKGYEESDSGNPTITELQNQLKILEDQKDTLQKNADQYYLAYMNKQLEASNLYKELSQEQATLVKLELHQKVIETLNKCIMETILEEDGVKKVFSAHDAIVTLGNKLLHAEEKAKMWTTDKYENDEDKLGLVQKNIALFLNDEETKEKLAELFGIETLQDLFDLHDTVAILGNTLLDASEEAKMWTTDEYDNDTDKLGLVVRDLYTTMTDGTTLAGLETLIVSAFAGENNDALTKIETLISNETITLQQMFDFHDLIVTLGNTVFDATDTTEMWTIKKHAPNASDEEKVALMMKNIELLYADETTLGKIGELLGIDGLVEAEKD
jgi:hypothetical protein